MEDSITGTKSKIYLEGYYAYMHWYWEGPGSTRPSNPYQAEMEDGDTSRHDEWQEGWIDASFDV